MLLEQFPRDSVVVHLFEVICESAFMESPDDPFGRIEVVPADAVSVILGEGVVVVVVSLSVSEERDEVIVDSRVLFAIRLASPVMGE